jgi:hypothetical protein
MQHRTAAAALQCLEAQLLADIGDLVAIPYLSNIDIEQILANHDRTNACVTV